MGYTKYYINIVYSEKIMNTFGKKIYKNGCTRIFAIFKQEIVSELTLDNQKKLQASVAKFFLER
jgi:hypothetical protein